MQKTTDQRMVGLPVSRFAELAKFCEGSKEPAESHYWVDLRIESSTFVWVLPHRQWQRPRRKRTRGAVTV